MLVVYIAEAHAADVWPINSSRCGGPRNTVLAPTSEWVLTGYKLGFTSLLETLAVGLAPISATSGNNTTRLGRARDDDAQNRGKLPDNAALHWLVNPF